jgi:hypothetical protein
VDQDPPVVLAVEEVLVDLDLLDLEILEVLVEMEQYLLFLDRQ